MQRLRTAFERVSGWPHAGRARCALAWSDGDAESLGESVTRAILLGAGFQVVSQLPIADRDGVVFARVDLGIEDTPVLLEFDGKVKYSDGGPDASSGRRSVRTASAPVATSSSAWSGPICSTRNGSSVPSWKRSPGSRERWARETSPSQELETLAKARFIG